MKYWFSISISIYWRYWCWYWYWIYILENIDLDLDIAFGKNIGLDIDLDLECFSGTILILILILKMKFQKILIMILNHNLILSHLWCAYLDFTTWGHFFQEVTTGALVARFRKTRCQMKDMDIVFSGICRGLVHFAKVCFGAFKKIAWFASPRWLTQGMRFKST